MSVNELDLEYRLQAVKAAKDLGYGKKVIAKIKDAKTTAEITRIMATARKEKFDEYD